MTKPQRDFWFAIGALGVGTLGMYVLQLEARKVIASVQKNMLDARVQAR